jgi:hypothetical protein
MPHLHADAKRFDFHEGNLATDETRMKHRIFSGEECEVDEVKNRSDKF